MLQQQARKALVSPNRRSHDPTHPDPSPQPHLYPLRPATGTNAHTTWHTSRKSLDQPAQAIIHTVTHLQKALGARSQAPLLTPPGSQVTPGAGQAMVQGPSQQPPPSHRPCTQPCWYKWSRHTLNPIQQSAHIAAPRMPAATTRQPTIPAPYLPSHTHTGQIELCMHLRDQSCCPNNKVPAWQQWGM